MTEKRIPYFIDLEDACRIVQMPGLETTILTGLHGERMMMVLTTLGPGVTVPAHSHPHEQVGIVYSGSASLRIGSDKRTVTEKDMYCIPAGVEHEATAVGGEPFVAFEVFHPVRDDFVEKVKLPDRDEHS